MKEKHFGPIWFIPGENNGKYPNCHSIYINGAGILIDPASDRKRLKELKENPGVKEVWLSHWHEDHFLHLDLFNDLPLCISEKDAPPLSDLETFMNSYGMDEQEHDNWRPIFEGMFKFVPRTPTRFLKDGEIHSHDNVTIEVITTPGHTPGHNSFFFKEEGILFLGDYDLTSFGPWYGDVDSSIEEIMSSVERLRNIPANVWLASHENGVFEEQPGELWTHYLGVIKKRENDLLTLLSSPKTFDDIVGACIVYGRPREPKAFYEFGEKAIMGKHLQKLIKEGRVAEKDGRYHSV